MTALGVHRIIERQSARGGDRLAIEGDVTLTYRELNHNANVVARELISGGLRRGMHVVVCLERSAELAIALLAILKAGAAYTWTDAGDGNAGWAYGISLVENGGVRTMTTTDIATMMAASRQAPNLPIITRAEDIACVLPQRDGLPDVLVPHSTITSLHAHLIPQRSAWSGDAVVLDLWLPLMAGATVTVDAAPARVAAA